MLGYGGISDRAEQDRLVENDPRKDEMSHLRGQLISQGKAKMKSIYSVKLVDKARKLRKIQSFTYQWSMTSEVGFIQGFHSSAFSLLILVATFYGLLIGLPSTIEQSSG